MPILIMEPDVQLEVQARASSLVADAMPTSADVVDDTQFGAAPRSVEDSFDKYGRLVKELKIEVEK